MSERIEPCRHCGMLKPINVWCSSDECRERVEAAMGEDWALRAVSRSAHDHGLRTALDPLAMRDSLARIEALFVGRAPNGYATLPELRAAIDGTEVEKRIGRNEAANG